MKDIFICFQWKQLYKERKIPDVYVKGVDGCWRNVSISRNRGDPIKKWKAERGKESLPFTWGEIWRITMQILRGFGNGKIEKFSSDGFYLLKEIICSEKSSYKNEERGGSVGILRRMRRQEMVYSVFSLVQFSHSVMSDSLQPHESQHARPPCPSPTPGGHSDSRPSSQWCHPAISSSGVPFSSCPQSLPALESSVSHDVLCIEIK